MQGIDNVPLRDLLTLTQSFPTITLREINVFITLVSRLKHDILLTQPASMTGVPVHLPLSVKIFLENACSLNRTCVESCWSLLKDYIWNGKQTVDAVDLFRKFGHLHGYTIESLYPPLKDHRCTAPACTRTGRGKAMKKYETRHAVLYTLDRGALPVYSNHLYCEACQINYHHGFRVEKGRRIYYDGMPEIIQAGEHQFFERKVIQMWITLMLVSWTSATNCARMYNLTLSTMPLPGDWKFGSTVTTEQVWDAFTILALLEDCATREKTLNVPHDGPQKDRFTFAVRERNHRFRQFSQPESRHRCKKCTRIFFGSGTEDSYRVWVVVIDGVTVGHPCCGVHNCQEPLSNNRHRFCPKDSHLGSICAIVGCSRMVQTGSLACPELEHQQIEALHRERGQAQFQLRERLQRARVAHPNDSIATEISTQDIEPVEEEVFEVDKQGAVRPVEEMGTNARGVRVPQKRKIRAQFGRKRTHNEQIIVAPCGMIIARETFYGAEGVGSVIEMIERTFHEDIKPNHIFFDNNCTLAKMVHDNEFFDDIGLTVDVFHFKSKHSENDTFCQLNCNPEAFEELKGDGGKGWYFNSSIAEQTNVWLGGYHSICREMLVERYNFFLDEMIMRRNRVTKDRLEKAGHSPQHWARGQ
ncbi:hypothetical protein FPV67DRAFT_1408151 [Lyophyllum atratum]|nr:hypothetical protein FPV67DRAFT_1408151 [Lyophyllum atratum]